MDILSLLLIVILVLYGVGLIRIGNEKLQIVGMLILIATFSYICSIRPLDSADTENYYNYYRMSQNISEFHFGFGRDYSRWVENWYINLCWLANLVKLTFSQFLFLVAFFFGVLSMYSVNAIYDTLSDGRKKMTGYLSIIALYYSNFGILYSYVVIRGGLSFALCLLAYTFLQRKKYLRSILIFLCSIALHRFSIIAIAVLALLKINFKKKHTKLLLCAFTILVVLSLLRIDIYFTRFLNTLTVTFASLFKDTNYFNAVGDTGAKKGILLYLLQNLYLMYLVGNSKKQYNTNIFFVLLAGSIIAVFANDNATIRIANYFFVFQLYLYAEYLIDAKAKKPTAARRNEEVERVMNQTLITIAIPAFTAIYMLRYCGIA